MPSHAIVPPNNFQNNLNDQLVGLRPNPVKAPRRLRLRARRVDSFASMSILWSPSFPSSRVVMKPADHPDFFRLPAPPGRSRESSIVLDPNGRFWHEGRPVEHAGLAAGLHSWINRHPDDGRYILTNGYDWTYFTVEDAPYFVRAIRVDPASIVLSLSDCTEETWDPAATRVGDDGALYAMVKQSAPAGPYEAKFTRHAQTSLNPVLLDAQPPRVRIGDRVYAIGAKDRRFG
jgi:uncharacterized protein